MFKLRRKKRADPLFFETSRKTRRELSLPTLEEISLERCLSPSVGTSQTRERSPLETGEKTGLARVRPRPSLWQSPFWEQFAPWLKPALELDVDRTATTPEKLIAFAEQQWSWTRA